MSLAFTPVSRIAFSLVSSNVGSIAQLYAFPCLWALLSLNGENEFYSFTGCYLTKEWSYLCYPLITRFLSRRRRGWHWGSFLLKEIPMSCLELVTKKSMILGHLLTAFIQMPLMRKTLSWTTFLLVMPLFSFPVVTLPFYLLAWLFRKKRIRFGGWLNSKRI